MSFRKRLLGDGTWAFSAKLLTGVAQILVAAVLARMLTVEEFGQFQSLQRVVMLGGILGSFGLAMVAVRKVAKGIARGQVDYSYAAIRDISRTILLVSLLLALLVLLFGRPFIEMVAGEISQGSLVLLSVLVVVAAFQQILPEFFRGLHDIRFSSLFSGASSNSILLLAVAAAMASGATLGLFDALLIYCCSFFLAVCMAAIVLIKMVRRWNVCSQLYLPTKKILVSGKPMLFSLLILFVVKQADVWLVASFVSLEVAAYYAAVSRMIFVLTVPLMVANAVIKPMLAKQLVEQNVSEAQQLTTLVTRGTFVVGLLPALIMFIWPQEILGLIFGDYYRAGDDVLRILACAQVITLFFGPCSAVLAMAGKETSIFRATLAGAGVFIVTVTLLLPSFQELAVAWAVLVGILFNQGLMSKACLRLTGVRTDLLAS